MHFPQQQITITNEANVESKLNCDSLILPALINLVQNAVEANLKTNTLKLDIKVFEHDKSVNFNIRDYGSGINIELLNSLGHETIQSEKGMGIALFLSNTTVNKLGGELMISNHPEGGAVANVRLPLL